MCSVESGGPSPEEMGLTPEGEEQGENEETYLDKGPAKELRGIDGPEDEEQWEMENQ